MKQVILSVEGSSVGSCGGWACILRYGESNRILSGSEPSATAQRMELKAVLEGLLALTEPCEVLVRTHSSYISDGLTRW